MASVFCWQNGHGLSGTGGDLATSLVLVEDQWTKKNPRYSHPHLLIVVVCRCRKKDMAFTTR